MKEILHSGRSNHQAIKSTVLILEDEKFYQEKLKKMVLEVFPASDLMIFSQVPVKIDETIDLAIVDISLESQKDGIDFLAKSGDRLSNVIFYSVCSERMKEAFGRNVVAFLEKSDPDEALHHHLLNIRNRLENERPECIQVTDKEGRTRVLHWGEIELVSRISRILWVTDLRGRQYRAPWPTVQEAGTALPGQFIQISRSEFINLHCIESVLLPEIRLLHGESCFVSRQRVRGLKQILETQWNSRPKYLMEAREKC